MTPIQRQILRFITESTLDNGYPPTVREIAAAVGRAPSSVHAYLAELLDTGAISRGPGPRTIVVHEEAP